MNYANIDLSTTMITAGRTTYKEFLVESSKIIAQYLNNILINELGFLNANIEGSTDNEHEHMIPDTYNNANVFTYKFIRTYI